MSDDYRNYRKLESIAKHLRALSAELDGEERGIVRVGPAVIPSGRTRMVRGKEWPAINFQVTDDQYHRWQFAIAFSPAGRTARIIDDRFAEGRIRWGAS